jgi:hypothetical protein
VGLERRGSRHFTLCIFEKKIKIEKEGNVPNINTKS